MKKLLSVSFAAVTAAAALCGCGKSAAAVEPRIIPQDDTTSQSQTDSPRSPKDISVLPDEKSDTRRDNAIAGFVRKHYFSRYGTYGVEYIHTPYGVEKDETLDYSLTLNPDNTFEFTVVSSGVTAEHSGRWYERRRELILYYDEEITDIPHNVYVADSMYADLLPHGKIMIYDNCRTIVLSKQPAADDEQTAR